MSKKVVGAIALQQQRQQHPRQPAEIRDQVILEMHYARFPEKKKREEEEGCS